MDQPQPETGRSPVAFWGQWGLVVLLAVICLGVILTLRLQRMGEAGPSLPPDHVVTKWDGWIVMAPAAPGTKPSPTAMPDAENPGSVSLSVAQFELLAELKKMRPDRAPMQTVPNPFPPQSPPTVAAVWEPLAKMREARKVDKPLIVLITTPLYLTAFQKTMSWSDPGGILVVISLDGLGDSIPLAPQRIAKLLRHEYGHLAGCAHRDGCVMTPIETVEALDRLPDDYCGDCASRIQALPYRVPVYEQVVRTVDPVTGQPV
ncbi:MAG: hypothetical protein ABI743_09475, partial [bacterium]